ncbi:centrosomal protein POC5 isoform X1 [Sorex fumeus]|uniref:centrosomal protein POC5 isoform X1 n=2 Tax=Sorex fumeus TaxID=62283 RepID=UPI0024ADD033|nr:centrosomal protein POC5 isoform X1 [Sorex fumeus]
MSSDEEKCSFPVMQSSSDSSVSSDLQEEYEELLRYAIVTQNIESNASHQVPSYAKGDAMPDVRIPILIDDVLHNQAGSAPAVREPRSEVGKGCDLNTSILSKTDGASPLSSPRKPSHPVMDFFSSNILGDSSSPGSNSTHPDVQQANNFVVSPESLQKVENILDLWSSGIKTNILSELTKWRLNFIDWHRMEMKKEKDRHAADLKQLHSQINGLKELQKTYEVSIGRKDEVISSLSHAIGKQKERIELMRTFFRWRINHVRCRQDVYEGKLADQYFRRTLLKKVWRGWHSIVQRQWKEVVERACQARAEEVCVHISNDYEAKVAMLSGALENAKAEIQRMQHEKEHFEDSMKKAFMRGVCALNLEAMTMFQNRNETGIDLTNIKKDEYDSGAQGKEHSVHLDPSAPSAPSCSTRAVTPPAAAAGPSSTAVFPSGASVATSGAASASIPFPVPSHLGTGSSVATAPEEMYVPRIVTSAQQKAGRTITARITGRCDFASKNRINSSLAIMGVSPPMSSVVVEKHHPVTVQTISQATAAKYFRTIHPETNASTSRSLGTRSAHTQSLSSIHSMKVVD